MKMRLLETMNCCRMDEDHRDTLHDCEQCQQMRTVEHVKSEYSPSLRHCTEVLWYYNIIGGVRD